MGDYDPRDLDLSAYFPQNFSSNYTPGTSNSYMGESAPALSLGGDTQKTPASKGLFGDLSSSIFGEGATSSDPLTSLIAAAIPGVVGGITGSQSNRYQSRQARQLQEDKYQYEQKLQAERLAADQRNILAQLALQAAVANLSAGMRRAEIAQGGAQISNQGVQNFLAALKR